MKTIILHEAGYNEAMLGLSLSYNQPVSKMPAVARGLIEKGSSHVKFLESMIMWLDVTAPRYWWSQFDTYRHVTKQSESTMHTLTKRKLTQDDFDATIPADILSVINSYIGLGQLIHAKDILPESFLQRRIVSTSYKTLANMYYQRIDHKLPQWQEFLGAVVEGIKYPEFIQSVKGAGNAR